MIKVLIADDHALIRKGLKQLLDDTDDMRVIGEAENGMQAIRMVEETDYDVVLLDISMPDKHGVDVLKQLRANRPQLPVLMLSMHPEEQYALRSMKAGAAGYLNKQSAPLQLVTAIRRSPAGRNTSAPNWRNSWPTGCRRATVNCCTRRSPTENTRPSA